MTCTIRFFRWIPPQLILSCGVLAWACPVLPSIAASAPAIEYPTRSIRLIVGQAPGGGLDIIARALAQKLTEALGQTVVVDNRPGAAGTLGSALAAKSQPDGYTALIVSVTYSINPSLYRNLPFDPVKDLQPVALIASTPFLLMVNPKLPVKTVRELIAFAKDRPGQLNYGSGGVGNSGHLAAALFSTMAGVELTHIPYKGTGLAVTDLLGGQIQILFNSTIQALPYARNGRLTILAITSAHRSAIIPDLPTIAESGLPGYDFSSWYGMMVPAGTLPPVINRLNAEILRTLSQADFKQRLSNDGSDPMGGTPEQFRGHLVAEMAKWEKVARRSGMRIE